MSRWRRSAASWAPRHIEPCCSLGVPIAELDQAFVWKQVLDTVDFALRASAQEPLFP